MIGSKKTRAEYRRVRKLLQERSRRLKAAGFGALDVGDRLSDIKSARQLRNALARLQRLAAREETTVKGAREAEAQRKREAYIREYNQRVRELTRRANQRERERRAASSKWRDAKTQNFVEGVRDWLPSDMQDAINPGNVQDWLDYIHFLNSAKEDYTIYKFRDEVRRMAYQMRKGATVKEVLTDMQEYLADREIEIEAALSALDREPSTEGEFGPLYEAALQFFDVEARR